MGRTMYWLLVSTETIAAGALLAGGLPAYRQILQGGGAGTPVIEIPGVLRGLVAVAAIQTCYWVNACTPPPPAPRRPGRWTLLLGRVLSFIAVLSFIFPGAVFSTVFLSRYDQLGLSGARLAFLVAVLFSMYLYMTELDRLGKRVAGEAERAQPVS